jgi:hypothetical protein
LKTGKGEPGAPWDKILPGRKGDPFRFPQFGPASLQRIRLIQEEERRTREKVEKVPLEVGLLRSLGSQFLPEGRNSHLAQGGNGPLGILVECSEGDDLITEKLHPHRILRRGREEIQDAAPAAELPPLGDLGSLLVAHGEQRLDQLSRRDDALGI